MIFLDTNIFIRFLTKDDPRKAAACRALFQQIQKGEVQATTSESIVAEILFILTFRKANGYKLSRSEASDRLKGLLSFEGLKLENKAAFFRALNLYIANPKFDLEDCLTVAYMEDQSLTTLLSYDTDFDQVTSINRREP